MPNSTDPISAVLSVLGILILFVAILYMAYWASRLAGKRFNIQGLGSEHVELIDQLALGQDRGLFVVRVAGKVLLLGVTAHQITKLEEFPPDAFAGLAKRTDKPAPFSESLRNALEKGWKFGGKQEKEPNKDG